MEQLFKFQFNDTRLVQIYGNLKTIVNIILLNPLIVKQRGLKGLIKAYLANQ